MFESLSGIPIIGLRNITSLPFGGDKIGYLDFSRGGVNALAQVPIGLGDWVAIETPGHTDDSMSLYSPTSRELICGDQIVTQKKYGTERLNPFHWNKDALVKTHQMLVAAIKPLVIYPGHGESIRDYCNALLRVGRP